MFDIGNDEMIVARIQHALHISHLYYIQQIEIEPVTDSGSMEKGITERPNALQKTKPERKKKPLH